MRSYLNTALFTASLVAASQESCKALVMSGGGSNGAWEVGVFWGFVNYGNPDDFAYDVVTGVSAGSINTLGFAGWEVGQETEAAQWLSDLWNNLKTSDVWKNWTLSIAEGLTIKAGLLDNSPLLAFMEKIVSDNFTKYGRRVSLSAANVNTGEFHTFDQKSTPITDLAKVAFASASIPTVFPPFNWEGVGLFMDGGTIKNVDIQAAIDQCLEVVNDESKITIDVLICSPAQGNVEETKESGKTIANILRSREINGAFHGIDAIQTDMKAHPSVNFRYLVNEEVGHAGTYHELEFDGTKTWPLQVQGRADAQAVLKSGEQTNFNKLNAYMQDEKLRDEFPSFTDYMAYLQ